jgi:hypothetical protein
MRTLQIKSGDRFGRLVAVKDDGIRSGRHYWIFLCDCGTIKTICASSVKNNSVRSCGCMHLERCKSGLNRIKHGDARVGHVTRLHGIWRGMLKRCYTKTSPSYNRYGGRGIRVCDEWVNNYVAFRDWSFNNGYNEKLTIDRIDNDKDYSPENCKYSTEKEQARNRNTTVWIYYNGKKTTIPTLADTLGLPCEKLRYKISKRGTTPEKAVSEVQHAVGTQGNQDL